MLLLASDRTVWRRRTKNTSVKPKNIESMIKGRKMNENLSRLL
jgi:hypothetical protein